MPKTEATQHIKAFVRKKNISKKYYNPPVLNNAHNFFYKLKLTYIISKIYIYFGKINLL